MTEKLLKMLVGETADFTGENYQVLQQTKSRLKQHGKGEWISSLGGFKGERTLTVKRIR